MENGINGGIVGMKRMVGLEKEADSDEFTDLPGTDPVKLTTQAGRGLTQMYRI